MKKTFRSLFLLFIFFSLSLCSGLASRAGEFILPEFSRTVSLEFKNADIRDVLRALSEQIGVNFVFLSAASSSAASATGFLPGEMPSAAGAVSGGDMVTVYLENVPVEEALSRILTDNGFSYEYDRDSNIVSVKRTSTTRRLETKVYHLKYMTVSSSKLRTTIGSGNDGNSAAVSSVTSGGSGGGITEILGTVLTENGKIAEDPRTNSVIITDVEENFPMIEKTIARLDAPVPQVLIEVEMLDVSKADTDKMGVKFSGTDDNFFSITAASRNTGIAFPFKTQTMKGYPGASVASADDSSSETLTTSRTFSSGGITSPITAALQFLKTRSDTRTLARPRILTLDNETAQIRISADEVVGLQVTTTSELGSGQTTEEAERMATGVFLTVTPQVNLLTREITMAVESKVSVAKTSNMGAQFKDPEERSVQAILKVKSGETVVMGGLLRKEASSTKTFLPILGEIPFLGALFRHKNVQGTDRELIIFLMPRILDDENMRNGFESAVNNVFLSDRERSFHDRGALIDQEMDNVLQHKGF